MTPSTLVSARGIPDSARVALTRAGISRILVDLRRRHPDAILEVEHPDGSVMTIEPRKSVPAPSDTGTLF